MGKHSRITLKKVSDKRPVYTTIKPRYGKVIKKKKKKNTNKNKKKKKNKK